MKVIFGTNDIDISLYIKCAFLFQLDENSGCYGNVQFPLTYKGTTGKAIKCFETANISTKVSTKMFLEKLPSCRFCSNDRLVIMATEMLNCLLSHSCIFWRALWSWTCCKLGLNKKGVVFFRVTRPYLVFLSDPNFFWHLKILL